jgi:hypothetical protein
MVSFSSPCEPFRRRKISCSVALLIVLNVTAFQPQNQHQPSGGRQLGGLQDLSRGISSCLFAANKKDLSAADRERRDEENRKRERKDDVVIGRTSAKRGEQDYQLDPKATEEEWIRQLSAIERKIYQYTEKGLEHLKMVSSLFTRDNRVLNFQLETDVSSHLFFVVASIGGGR